MFLNFSDFLFWIQEISTALIQINKSSLNPQAFLSMFRGQLENHEVPKGMIPKLRTLALKKKVYNSVKHSIGFCHAILMPLESGLYVGGDLS